MDILIGTKNQFKFKEMLWHLEGLENITIHTMDELQMDINVEEDGKTLKENAEKKALEISQHTDWLVFTSDAGVDIPGLGEKWDMTRPKRIVGEHKSDKEKIDTLLEMMRALKGDQRASFYHIALALAKNGKLLWSQEIAGESGMIVEEDHTENIEANSWMAVVWNYPELGKTDYQLTPGERTKIRHKYQLILKQELQSALRSLDPDRSLPSNEVKGQDDGGRSQG